MAQRPLTLIPEFIAVGCNGIPHCVSSSSQGIIAYGAGTMIALYDETKKKICKTLIGHSKRINSIVWVESHHENVSPFLISCSADGSIRSWEKSWDESELICQEEVSIICVKAILQQSSNGILLVASVSDGRILVFFKDQKEWKKIQQIEFSSNCMMESLAIKEIHHDDENHPSFFLFACGGVDHTIRIFVESNMKENEIGFKNAAVLKGHMDWIRSLDFQPTSDATSFLLASASQDHKIRLWRFSKVIESRKLNPLLFSVEFNDQKILHYQVDHEALLLGHENFVSSVCWSKTSETLLSASLDSTMILWKNEDDDNDKDKDKDNDNDRDKDKDKDKDGEVLRTLSKQNKHFALQNDDKLSSSKGFWIPTVRVGESSAMGFLGCCFSSNEESILANSYMGSIYKWKEEENGNKWVPALFSTGHTSAVKGLSWDASSSYLLSVSSDQTTRLFAPWMIKSTKGSNVWYEFSRPQIHGYNMNCVTSLKSSNYQFVSGGDEKILRAFSAPKGVLDTLTSMCGLKIDENPATHQVGYAAYAPELSLTNRIEESPSHHVVLNSPPLEENLSRSTLWPEIQKLYGHGNEVISVCCSHKGDRIASSCKGRDLDSSAIIIWDTQKWISLQHLTSHTSTVIALGFSSSDQYLLSVSKDRHFTVFERKEDQYEIVQRTAGHKRIIWSCSWTKGDSVFATGSRDQTVKIWKKLSSPDSSQDPFLCVKTLSFNFPVTSLSFDPYPNITMDVLAIGLDNGFIELWKVSSLQVESKKEIENVDQKEELGCELLHRIGHDAAHASTVTCLSWKVKPFSPEGILTVASSSTDHSVRIYNLQNL